MRRWTRFALSAILPSYGPVPGVAEGGLDALLDRLDVEAPFAYRLALYGGTLLVLVSPIATLGRPVPAHWLPADALDEHVHRLATHRIYLVRQAMFAMKMIAGLSWGSDAAVREGFGMPPLPDDPGTWRGDGYLGRSA